MTATARREAGQLLARPRSFAPAAWPLPEGVHPLGMGDGRDGLLRVPPPVAGPLPLIVMLHGYGAGAEKALRRILPIAAVVAVLSALGGDEAPPARRRPEWGAPHRGVRRDLPHGAGGWRSSALPR